MKFDLTKSIQELENSDWGDPENGATPLISECLHLRRVPLKEFQANTTDLITMIDQQIGIIYLIPMALEHLRIDPLADRDFYPGNLLCSVLKAPFNYWNTNANFRKEVEQIYQKVLINEKNDEDLSKETIKYLKNSHLYFEEFGRYISMLWDNPVVKSTCNHVAVNLLAIIASRQPIRLRDLEAIVELTISDEMIEFLLKNQWIIYDCESPYRSLHYFSLSENFMKQIDLSKN